MKTYIHAASCLSPQPTWENGSFLSETVGPSNNRFACMEPDYRQFIDGKLLRRMSRIIKMGVAAASACLNESGIRVPDAIITGTAYGCLEDTGQFLTKMVQNNEELLTPTAFIQSTHNTVGAQIALMLQCHGYNNTFVHRGFSFESALLDAVMLLQENEVENVLAGSVDEITDISHAVLTRMGLYKGAAAAGEGAAFFLLAGRPSAGDYACLDGIFSFYRPEGVSEVEKNIAAFLASHSVGLEDIDLIITGTNGDVRNDRVYRELEQSVFKDKRLVAYKHLCGEYPTSASFALWVAVTMLKTKEIPAALRQAGVNGNKLNRILVYNHYQNIHHSLILVSEC